MSTRATVQQNTTIKQTKSKRLLEQIWHYRAYYLMLTPAVIYFLIYRYAPMYGAIIAFKDFNIAEGIMGSPWADPWYAHFQQFYESPYFTQLIANTFLISSYKLLFGMLPPIILAIFLNEARLKWFSRSIQTLSYMPHFLSWVIIYGILIAFLSQTNGLINRWIGNFGFESIPFLTSTDWFRSIIVGSDIWQSLGWGAIIYLAAIAGISPTLYEAAKVDGASRLRMVWHITLPGIRNVIILLLILRLGQFLEAGFEQIYILYNIQVYSVADIIDTWVFRVGLEQMNYSIAAAVGLFKSAVGLVLILIANSVAKKWGENLW